YVGTFTDGFMGGAVSEGLYVFRFDVGSERAHQVQVMRDVFSPSFVCLHPSGRWLFAAERQVDPQDRSTGAISAWAIGEDGLLAPAWKIASGGASCAHISVARDGRALAVANPLGPTVAVCRLGPDGMPAGPLRVARHSGTGARPRQANPWPHSATFDADGRHVLACDLGLDRLFVYETDGEGALSPGQQPYAQVSSGAGARHMAWSADASTVYVANELDSTISVFDYGDGPRLICKQTIAATADDQPNQPAEIVVSPDGRRLYVSNRGADCISVFEILAGSQRLRLRSQAPVMGNTPRHFALSADGAYGFVVNQLSGEIVGYRVDRSTGDLSPIGIVCSVPNPSCVAIGAN
ncbi:MAG: lactonase family protein, partial [Sphingomonadales bacterium]|nr:lactonase family protein [Sphingomonadales bacterium]